MMFACSFALGNFLVKTELCLKSKTQTLSEQRVPLKQSSWEKQNILQDGIFWIPPVLQTNQNTSGLNNAKNLK